jgi:hypothetical protein
MDAVQVMRHLIDVRCVVLSEGSDLLCLHDIRRSQIGRGCVFVLLDDQ